LYKLLNEQPKSRREGGERIRREEKNKRRFTMMGTKEKKRAENREREESRR